MPTFHPLVVVGAGTALIFSAINQVSAQLPSVEPAIPSPSPSASPAPEAEPSPSGTVPAPTPNPALSPAATTSPSPTAPVPNAQPIPTPSPGSPASPSPLPAELNNLSPNPNLLERPTTPNEVQIQTTQPITLQQALEIARRNNRELQVGLLELERSRAGLREARASLLPTLGVGANLIRQSGASGGGSGTGIINTGGTSTGGTGTGTPVVTTPGTGTTGGTSGTGTTGTTGSGTTGSGTTGTTGAGTTGSGLITPASGTGTTGTSGTGTGTQLTPSQPQSLNLQQVVGDPTVGNLESRNNSAVNALTGTLELNYDVFTSGRRSATIRAAEEQVRFSELEVERLAEQLRLDVSNDYYSVQEADEQGRIARSAVENAQASLRDAQALERGGIGTRFDVLRAQVQVANEQQGLTEALAQQRIARRQLAQRLSIAQTVDVSAADPVAIAARWDRTIEDSIVLAFRNRAELEQQLTQRNISRQQRRIALAELGPQVSVFANYNVQNISDDNRGFYDGYSYGARVNLNLFNGGSSRARAAQQDANIAIAETNFANTRNQVRFQVEQAYFTLQSRLENTRTATEALRQARESLRLARLRFQAGVGTQTDVIAAETELTRAEGNLVQAIIGYNRALASLQREVSVLQETTPVRAQ